MAKNGGAPGADVVDVFIAIDIPDAGALGVIDEERLAANGAKSADGGIDAAGDERLGLGEEGVRLGVVHDGEGRRKFEIRNQSRAKRDRPPIFICSKKTVKFEFSPPSALESRRGTIHSGRMKAKVTVMPKKSVLDPQGIAVRDAMRHHGLPGVKSVRIGKFMEIDIEQADEAKLHEICRDLLSNPVIEDYELHVES